MELGIYKNKLYRLADTKDKKLFLMSREEAKEFTEAIRFDGKIIKGLYEKEVAENDLEDAYELNGKVIYKGREFDVSSSMANIIKTNKLIIGTLDYPLTEELGGFERVDKYYYEKEVSFDEIDKFLEVKKPLFHFKNTKSVTIREIPKDEIIKHALYIESFA
ncbi:MAG: hypothetical protein GYA50_05395 [Eubacteriaceae bacterium]|nr:hypothetical protein [Eubacteriaceae bacterium]